MADSKLRLQIITALDNAGIKATKDQIDGIEKSLTKVNQSDGFGKVEKQLGQLKGPLKDIGPIFDGIGGKIAKIGGIATMVIGAFKAGWDIGSWLNEKVISPLLGIEDPLEKLKKKNKELHDQQEKTVNRIQDMAESSSAAYSLASQNIDHQVQQIDKLHQAWTKAAMAKNAYDNADQDIEIQQLERERFENVMRFQNAGDFEGAEQVNAMYDVYKQIMIGQKEIAKFDQETAILEKGITKDVEKRQQLMQKIIEASANVVQKRREFNAVQENGDAYATQHAYDRAERNAQKSITVAQNQLRRLEDELQAFDASNTGMLELATRRKQRAVLADQLMLGVDQSAWKYDQNVMANGNLIGWEFTDEFKQTLAESSKQSYDDLERAITEGVKEGIAQLMEVK